MKITYLTILGITVLAYVNSKSMDHTAVHDTRVMEAAQSGNISLVQQLIKNKAQLNTQDSDGNTALLWAIRYADKSIAQVLIKAGADVDIQNNKGRNALIAAIECGDKATVQALIKAQPHLDTQDNYGRTALIMAARYGQNSTIKALIKAGAHLDLADNEGNTALVCATHWSFSDTQEILINAGACINVINNNLNTPFIHACNSGYTQLSDMLLIAEKTYAQVCALAKRPFPTACLKETDPARYYRAIDKARTALGDLRRLAQKLIFVSYVDAWGNSPIHHAVQAGNRPAVVVLLGLMAQAKRGESIERRNGAGYTPVDIAVLSFPTHMLPLLFQFGDQSLPAAYRASFKQAHS